MVTLRFALGAAILMGWVMAPAAQEPATPTDVLLEARGHGWILQDADGMTLYTYMSDPIGGPPACKDECVQTWRPLLVSEDTGSAGDWSQIKRDEDTWQWTFRGKPLYTYSRDLVAGDMNGDEHQRKWYVAVKPIDLPPGFDIYKTLHGYLLVDQKKITLYTSSADEAGSSICVDDCAKTWQPVEAWWRARSILADWSFIDRPDGTKQWAYKDQPLYRYAADFQPGEMSGDGTGTFAAVVLEPPQSVPSWTTYQNSDAGPLLADAHGKTLYAHDVPERRAFGIGIGRDMATPHLWKAVTAEGPAASVGHWSVVASEDGAYQWTYKGLRLYTHNRDSEPGDLNGQRSTDRYWRTIMKDGKVMPGSGR